MDISEKFHIYSSQKNWLEGDAVTQFKQVSQWQGITAGVGYPDLHPGRGVPVGAAFIAHNMIYPSLIGSDIGCGMTLAMTDLPQHKFKAQRLFRALDGDPEQKLRETALRHLADMPEQIDDPSAMLGTLGHGNHFAEILAVEKIEDEAAALSLGLDRSRIFMLVHSGSRNYGDKLWREFAAENAHAGVTPDSPSGAHYLAEHDKLLKWAQYNRALILRALADIFNCTFQLEFDTVHNSITPLSDGNFLHRKGAAAAQKGAPVLVAGSRGSFSYLVMPEGDPSDYCYSLAHGAGRKWNRLSTRVRMRSKHTVQELQKTRLGSRVLCPDKELLFEEAPEAYKNIEQVVSDLVEFKLAKVIAVLRPVLNCKP